MLGRLLGRRSLAPEPEPARGGLGALPSVRRGAPLDCPSRDEAPRDGPLPEDAPRDGAPRMARCGRVLRRVGVGTNVIHLDRLDTGDDPSASHQARRQAGPVGTLSSARRLRHAMRRVGGEGVLRHQRVGARSSRWRESSLVRAPSAREPPLDPHPRYGSHRNLNRQYEGWRNEGWRNEGWRSGGWRSGGWRSGGRPSESHPIGSSYPSDESRLTRRCALRHRISVTRWIRPARLWDPPDLPFPPRESPLGRAEEARRSGRGESAGIDGV